jgi:superfamily II DNA or RNA helicase
MQLRTYQNTARNGVLLSDIGQVIAPTGTGKSVIQGAVFESLINMSFDDVHGFGIYVILTPRIMLTNQLMTDVGQHLIGKNIHIRTLTIHSGQAATFGVSAEEDIDDYTRYVFSNLGMVRTTSGDDAAVAIKEAQFLNRPLLVCCTYDSVPALRRAIRILREDQGELNQPDLKIDQVLCDEAHYIVEKQFFKNIEELKPYVDRMHFFTATQKVTMGDQGNGMNNQDFYGPVVFRCTPRQMIDQGYMVRPRIHYERAEAGAPWSRMVADAFDEHQKQVSKYEGTYNAKMLVCCNGSKTIQEITESPGFREWAKKNEITIFAVSSAHGASIDYEQVTRNEFLKELKAHTGRAVILHINILTEGIDVPDITGVMFIRNMGMTRFLQSLGRATRVLKNDLGKPTNNFDVNSEFWKKPYAWAIISERDGDDEGKTSGLRQMIEDMRMAGFEPTEEVVIAIDRAKKIKEEFVPCNEKDPKIMSTFSDLFDIEHDIEVEKLAALNDAEFDQSCPI